jgi:hypothetical protein
VTKSLTLIFDRKKYWSSFYNTVAWWSRARARREKEFVITKSLSQLERWNIRRRDRATNGFRPHFIFDGFDDVQSLHSGWQIWRVPHQCFVGPQRVLAAGTLRVHFRKRSAHAPPTAPFTCVLHHLETNKLERQTDTNGRTNAQLTAVRQDGWTDGRSAARLLVASLR